METNPGLKTIARETRNVSLILETRQSGDCEKSDSIHPIPRILGVGRKDRVAIGGTKLIAPYSPYFKSIIALSNQIDCQPNKIASLPEDDLEPGNFGVTMGRGI